MIDVSVVIVNYNVRHFLRQTLLSVRAASPGLVVEVIVVDNASHDDSTAMVEEEFPEVILVKSTENLGFSKANNQALGIAKGRYCLLLNPDTILSETTLTKCCQFMDNHPEVGALGPRMIDGSGFFLPESKRGFPSPSVAFYKAFGLSRMFRRSAHFNRYHMGHLPEDKPAGVDVLAGAFMFIRREIIKGKEVLDERFFMYGEDIDFSYRLKEAGYRNWYYPETTIIHFKGESTKKGSLNYVKVFYQAMILFADKHFKGQKAKSFIALMKMGVGLRAFLDILKGISYKLLLPLFDFICIFLGLCVFKEFWEVYYFDDPDHFDGTYIYYHMAIYTSVWMSGAYLFGGYEKRFKTSRVLQGILIASLIQFAIYGMLNPHYRPSRMMLIMGTFWALTVILFNRILPHFIQYGNLDLGQDQKKRIAIVGQMEETERIVTLLDKMGTDHFVVDRVEYQVGRSTEWKTKLIRLIEAFRLEEIIWAVKDVPYAAMIDFMRRQGRGLSHKMIDGASEVMLGSRSKNDRGELYLHRDKYALSGPVTIRLKRLLDLMIVVVVILLLPILFFCRGNRMGLLVNLGRILRGDTWIGYFNVEGNTAHLPPLPKGILTPVYRGVPLDDQVKRRANEQYALHYRPLHDLRFLYYHLCHLGRRRPS